MATSLNSRPLLSIILFTCCLLGFAACASPGSVLGAYVSKGVPSGEATLQLFGPDRYQFCHNGECSNGIFEIVWQNGSTEGRIKFQGTKIEEYYKQTATSFHANLPDYVTKRWGEVEANYWIGPMTTVIDIEFGSDAMFVRK